MNHRIRFSLAVIVIGMASTQLPAGALNFKVKTEDVTVQPGDTVVLKVTVVSDTPKAEPLDKAVVLLSTGPYAPVGQPVRLVTDKNGVAQLQFQLSPLMGPGKLSFTAEFQGMPPATPKARASGTITVLKADTVTQIRLASLQAGTATFEIDARGKYGQSTGQMGRRATVGGKPVPIVPLSGAVGNAQKQVLRIPIPATNTIVPIVVTYAGDAIFNPSTATRDFAGKGDSSISTLSLFGRPGEQAYGYVTLNGEMDGTLKGRTLRVLIEGSPPVTLTTVDNGRANMSGRIPSSAKAGDKVPCTISWDGDAAYNPATLRSTISVDNYKGDVRMPSINAAGKFTSDFSGKPGSDIVLRFIVNGDRTFGFGQVTPLAGRELRWSSRSTAFLQNLPSRITTDGQGRASLAGRIPPVAVGTSIDLTLQFDGDALYNPATALVMVRVSGKTTWFAWRIPGLTTLYGQAGMLVGGGSPILQSVEADKSVPLAGKTVKVSIQGLPPFTVTTTDKGVVDLTRVRLPANVKPGDKLAVSMSYDGEGDYVGSTFSATVDIVK
jgi:hypothetical protein